jgi:DNA invertase Pin-like site-specific DNA recombinase
MADSEPLSADGFLIGYARVSTEEQILDLQINALRSAGCAHIFREKVSGAGKRRPQLDLAIKDLQPGDTLVVWRLDRLARNQAEFYRRLEQIHQAGARFRSLSENFDFSTAMGRFVLGILALTAELERQLVVGRTKAGMAAARARGSQIGAPIKFTPHKQAKARAWLKQGLSIAAVARRLNLSASTIRNFQRRGMKPYSTKSIVAPSRF